MSDADAAASFRELPVAAAAERERFEEEGGDDCAAFAFPTAASFSEGRAPMFLRGAKVMRWCGQGPCLYIAATCAAVP
jgi:hypothetical protein